MLIFIVSLILICHRQVFSQKTLLKYPNTVWKNKLTELLIEKELIGGLFFRFPLKSVT